ncbi:MAG: choice-of-anchor J domain-containing protein [Prolixibacteraceae bacterium]|nr:choice-of-anchor J domain-containing protein [Prolixibacteraceae bacterium]
MKKLLTFLAIFVVTLLTVSAQVNEDFATVTKGEAIELDNWINYVEAGSVPVEGHEYNDELFAYFNPYNSGDDSNIMWFITPGVDLNEFENDSVKFDLAYGYFKQTEPLAIKYSLDFDGTENGISSATWVDITDQCNIPTEDELEGTFTPFLHTSLDIDDLEGTIYVAFVYTGSGNNSETTAVELDNVVVGNPKPQSRITGFSVSEQLLSTDIDLENTAVSLTVYPATDVTSLTPEIELSEGASISPAIGSAQDFSSPFTYTVTSSDGESITEWTVTVDVLSDTPTSIYDLQYVSDPEADDASPFEGEPVYTTGIVTYGTGEGSAYVQSASGEWNGIYVYVSSGSDISLSKGDSVKMYGTIEEYYHLTEFKPDSVQKISDRKSIEPVTVSLPLSESTEGVLVKVEGLTIKNNGEDDYFGITEANDTVIIENELFSGLSLTEDATYNITGVVDYSYSKYRLFPRSSGDVESLSSVKAIEDYKLSVYPNPASNVLYIKGASTENIRVTNIVGKTVTVYAISENSIDISSLQKGLYLLSVDSKITRFIKK